jgi:hypothetical protein
MHVNPSMYMRKKKGRMRGTEKKRKKENAWSEDG